MVFVAHELAKYLALLAIPQFVNRMHLDVMVTERLILYDPDQLLREKLLGRYATSCFRVVLLPPNTSAAQTPCATIEAWAAGPKTPCGTHMALIGGTRR